MKTENYRVFLKDKNGNTINFERFSCKSLKTVTRNMYTLLESELYRIATGKFNLIEYYSVKNGKIDKLLKCESV